VYTSSVIHPSDTALMTEKKTLPALPIRMGIGFLIDPDDARTILSYKENFDAFMQTPTHFSAAQVAQNLESSSPDDSDPICAHPCPCLHVILGDSAPAAKEDLPPSE
jgi:hypothetical protein